MPIPDGLVGRLPIPLFDPGYGWRLLPGASRVVTLLQQGSPIPLRGACPWELTLSVAGVLAVTIVCENRPSPPADVSTWAPLVSYSTAGPTAYRRYQFDFPVEWVAVYATSGAGNTVVRVVA